MMLLHKRGAPALLLPEFLKEVYVGQRSGLLHVTRDESSSVTFRSVNGEIVSGSSSAEKGRLGESMVRRGLISRTDLERALMIVTRQRRRLAPVLRELDLLDTPGLEKALAVHIREMLLTALLWDDSVLLFEDQELPDAPAEDLTLRCSMAELILELAQELPGQETVRQALGDVDRPLVAADDATPLPMDRPLAGPAERYLLLRADGKTPARSILEAARVPGADMERSLLGLLCTGALRYANAAPGATPGPMAATSGQAGSR